MGRLLYARPATGRLARQIDEVFGDGSADVLIAASGGYPHVMPVSGAPGMMVDGEFYPTMAGGGWADIDDLIAETRTNGKLQTRVFDKPDSNNTASVGVDLFTAGGYPGVGGAAALPGGTALDNTSTGAVELRPAPTGERLHFLGGRSSCGAPATFILVDMLWRGAIAINSAAAQSITGVPTRYTGADAAGNVVGVSISGSPAATAHNHTVRYVDEQGNAAELSGSTAGIAGGATGRIDFGTAGQWFLPLNAGDMGVRNLTEYTMSAAVASGGWHVWVAKPLAFLPAYVGGIPSGGDAIVTGFNLVEIKNGACLTLLKLMGSTNNTINTAEILIGSG